VKIERTRRGARIREGDVILSEILALPGPTHSLFDLLAAGIAALAPGPRVAMLGFAGGGVVAPLRAMGWNHPLCCVDLSGDAEPLWDAIMDTGRAYGLQPAGNHALDMVRIEAGLLLIDVDFVSARHTLFEVQRTSPYELGLGWMVKLDKDFFVGREALRRERKRGPVWNTVGIVVDVDALEEAFARFRMPLHLPYTSWNAAVPVYADMDRQHHIGKATSGTWSPILKSYVAICRVQTSHGELGRQVYLEETVEGQRFAIPAKIVEMPFFDPPRKRDL